MITKDQAQNSKQFLQIHTLEGGSVLKPVKWRANGKCKTWKRQPEKFKLPIKYGLYSYSYITNENAHLFTVE